jgi:Flp pilus assembly protein TadG
MALDSLKRLRDDTDGAAFLEFTVFAMFFFTLLFGIVEFTLAYYQWNAGTKAVQLGARLAAVSNPVASGLESLTGLEGSANPGDPMSDFSAVCQSNSPTGATGTCTCTGFTCSYDSVDSAAAVRRVVFGKGDRTACSGEPPAGMCNLFSRVTPENVVVTYTYTGLGYAGRPGGPVPTIRVELVDIPMQFIFFDALFGLNDYDIPGLASTVTGEDLSIAGS